MSLYGADPLARQVEFLYKVTGAGTRGLAYAHSRRQPRHHGAARHRLHARSEAGGISWRSGAAPDLRPSAPLAQGGARRTASASPRSSARGGPSCSSRSISSTATAPRSIAGDRFAERPADPRNVERILRGLIARRPLRCVLYLRFEPPDARAAAAGARIRSSRAGRDGAADGLRHRAFASAACAISTSVERSFSAGSVGTDRCST